MNKSERAVLNVIRGNAQWETLYNAKTGMRKKSVGRAIESLKNKKIIYKDKNSVLKEIKQR